MMGVETFINTARKVGEDLQVLTDLNELVLPVAVQTDDSLKVSPISQLTV